MGRNDEHMIRSGRVLQESNSMELKQEFTPNIIKTVVAFANTKGGTLYIGVADDGSIIGLPNPDKVLRQTTSSVRDSIKPDVTLFIDYKTETREGKNVIRVSVQKGTKPPYYLSGKGIRPEGVFVRDGSSTVPATETAIYKMIKESGGEKYEEQSSLNQELTFKDASRVFKSYETPFGEVQQKSLKLINENGIYTNLALLLSDQCPHTMKLAVFEGVDKLIFKDRKEFSGSLLRQLDDVFDAINFFNRTRATFETLKRIDIRDYPPEAIREALLNAIIHRDYSYNSSTLISVFDDRLEFVSIGGLAKGISLNDIWLGVSMARNSNLANIFYRLKLIEAYGTGIPKIMRNYSDFNKKPEIETSDNAFKITLPNANITRTPLLSENELSVISILERQGYTTRKEVEEAVSVSQATAGRLLKNLVDKKLIALVGRGKNRRYVNLTNIYYKKREE